MSGQHRKENAMDNFRLLSTRDLLLDNGQTIQFEGKDHGAGVCFILQETDPGAGPALHRHPYSETWVVQSGRARFTVDGRQIEAGAGDIVVAGPNTPHRFVNPGPDRLKILCIHASDRFVTEWLAERTQTPGCAWNSRPKT
jgi:mannose-6-phosphate isomerase-like protein (cupin superfamily)